MDWEYDEIQCSGCGEYFSENELHFNFMIYRLTLFGDELETSAYEYLKWFHLECCDMNLLNEKFKTKLTCDDCGREINDGESFWEIGITKEKHFLNSVEPEWSESLSVFCEDCAQQKDLFIIGIEVIKSVVNPEYKDNIEPMDGTFIPSQIKYCESCGAVKCRGTEMI